MRVSWWTSGFLAAFVGCSGVDPHNTPSSRPLVNDRTLSQLPPPGVPAWQQNRGPLAYRPAPGTTGFPSGIGANSGTAALGQPLTGPYGAVALGNSLPGQPVPDGRALTSSALAAGGTDSGFSAIQRVGYEERPLRVLPPDNQARVHDLNRTPAVEAPRPLLMAGPESTPLEDGALNRRSMRPATPADAQDSLPRAGVPSAFTPAPAPMASAPMPEREVPPVAQTARPEEMPLAPPAASTRPEERSAPAAVPAVRMVNSKRIILNYELKDVGPSGVSAVELWYTRDGRTWHRDEAVTKQAPPYIFEVPDEGMYGFTLLAKNGVGLGKQSPQAGDLPQVWVEVDLTRPVVSLVDVRNGHGPKAREVTVTWNAQDRNLARRPVTLFWSERSEGPWLPVAANIENTGQHTWTVPPTGPVCFYTRIEAVDLVGNVGVSQSSKPMSIDTSQPTVSILTVEPGDR